MIKKELSNLESTIWYINKIIINNQNNPEASKYWQKEKEKYENILLNDPEKAKEINLEIENIDKTINEKLKPFGLKIDLEPNKDILISIKPKFVKEIVSGKKKFEFRKVIFKKPVNRAFIYSSYPVKKIIGYFNVGKIHHLEINKLWDLTKNHSGITHDLYLKYYSGKEKGFAIEINNFIKLKTPINPYKLNPKFRPPQSFCYIDSFPILFQKNDFNKRKFEVKKDE